MSTTVCICKNVSKDTIVDAIKQGADTFEAVQETTGAGTGPCRAGRCKSRILELIEENK